VCVCVREREREKKKKWISERQALGKLLQNLPSLLAISYSTSPLSATTRTKAPKQKKKKGTKRHSTHAHTHRPGEPRALRGQLLLLPKRRQPLARRRRLPFAAVLGLLPRLAHVRRQGVGQGLTVAPRAAARFRNDAAVPVTTAIAVPVTVTVSVSVGEGVFVEVQVEARPEHFRDAVEHLGVVLPLPLVALPPLAREALGVGGERGRALGRLANVGPHLRRALRRRQLRHYCCHSTRRSPFIA
jgi:hypothetical protein